MDEYGMNEFEMIKKADVMRIINAENAVVLNNLKERSTDEVLCAIAAQINDLQTTIQIESEPVRHGHWVLTRDEQYEYCRCSKCGYDTGENWAIGSEIPYCEQCGSKNYDGGADNG